MKNLLVFDYNLNDLCSRSDNELAVLAKNNKSAAALLVSRYWKLIYVKSGIYANSNTEFEDLCQEGMMGLLSAIGSFDSSREIKFSTFAEVCIVNRMKSLLIKGNRLTATVENIDELSENSSFSCETPESIYLYKEYFSELMRDIKSVLSPFEMRVFNLYIQGKSYRSIAGELDMTEKSVDNAMQRARRKIRPLI